MNMVDPNKISGNLPEDGSNTRAGNAQTQDENNEIICLFCKREVKNKCTINNNEHLLNAVASLNIEYYSIPSVVDYSCFQCIKDILLLAEQRRMIQRNILKSRANHFVRCGNKKMCAKYLAETKSVSGKNHFVSTPPGPSNLKITDVRTITRNDVDNMKESEPLMNGYTANCVPKNCEAPTGTSENILLDIMYEQQESVLATESGGQVDHESTVRSILSSSNISSSIKCQYCPRTYSRHRYLRKHEKRHLLQIQNTQKDRRNKPSVFKCSSCDIVLESLASLKSHETNLHINKLKCSYCEEEFLLRSKLELHEAICLGKIGASQRNGRHQYYTRSRRTNQSEDGGTTADEETVVESEPSFNARINRWLVGVEDTDNISQYSKTIGSSSRRSSPNSIPTQFPSVSDVETIETDTTESVSSTIFNNKRRKIKKNDTIRSSKSGKRRKSISSRNIKWLCPVEECGYMDASLDSLMNHDIECHDPLPLFYCKKCRGRFARRFYLEQHLKYQSYGRWVCCRCDAQFDNEPDLKLHFEEHNDADRHHCEICNLTFITDHELQKHLCTNEHFDKKKVRKCIFLERRQYTYKAEPIEQDQEQPPEQNSGNPSKKRYKSVIKVLKLMDQERRDCFDFISFHSSWKRGVIFQIPPETKATKAQNCAGLILPKP